MEFSEYIAYFEEVSRKHKGIGHTDAEKHFYRLDIEELITGLRSDLNFPCLLLESLTGHLNDTDADSVQDILTGAFTILKQVDPGDFTMEMQALQESIRIGKDIISKIRHDSRRTKVPVIEGFFLSSVLYEKVGPVFDNCYGYRFMFSFQQQIDLSFNPDSWNS